jgi:hypothetical protein
MSSTWCIGFVAGKTMKLAKTIGCGFEVHAQRRRPCFERPERALVG